MDSIGRYSRLAYDYLYAAELLNEAYLELCFDPINNNKCRPLFFLLGHSCECCLKAYISKEFNYNEKEISNKYDHDLFAMQVDLVDYISNEMKELIFYLGNSHYAKIGKKTSQANRFDDNKFDDKQENDRRALLLKKQEKHGYSSDKPIYIGQATEEQKKYLEPELSSYSEYLFKKTQMKPQVDFALSTIKNELDRLNQIGNSNAQN